MMTKEQLGDFAHALARLQTTEDFVFAIVKQDLTSGTVYRYFVQSSDPRVNDQVHALLDRHFANSSRCEDLGIEFVAEPVS